MEAKTNNLVNYGVTDNGIANYPHGIADSSDTSSIIPGKPETNESQDKIMYITRKVATRNDTDYMKMIPF